MTKQLRILVVDDDEDNAASLSELFEMEGHHVTTAYTGESAIEAYLGADFDIAFMDVMMPGKNGVESFLEIKKMKPGAKVYMMTGYSVEQLLQQAMDNGAMGVLGKPIDVQRLKTALKDVSSNGIVLVSDENPQCGAELKQMMDKAGMPCDLVRSETDVVHAGTAATIIDLDQPLIDGVDVYKQLKSRGVDVPAIIVTRPAEGEADTIDSLRDIKVTGVLNKPFDPLSLLNRLATLAA